MADRDMSAHSAVFAAKFAWSLNPSASDEWEERQARRPASEFVFPLATDPSCFASCTETTPCPTCVGTQPMATPYGVGVTCLSHCRWRVDVRTGRCAGADRTRPVGAWPGGGRQHGRGRCLRLQLPLALPGTVHPVAVQGTVHLWVHPPALIGAVHLRVHPLAVPGTLHSLGHPADARGVVYTQHLHPSGSVRIQKYRAYAWYTQCQGDALCWHNAPHRNTQKLFCDTGQILHCHGRRVVVW